MDFYSAYNPGPVESTPAGEMEIPVFDYKTNSKGVKELVMTDKKQNIYDIKQEYLEESKVENIIRRYTMGDLDALNKRKGQYIDTTKMPTTLAGWEQARINAENEFDKLPLEVRKEYDYNAIEYYDSLLDGSAENRINKALGKPIVEKQVEQPVEQIKETLEYPNYQPGGNLNG